jgi:thioredoxin 1
MAGPLNIDESTFDAEVKQAEGLVMVDFWAPWCGPCRLIAPVLEELAAENGDAVKITKVNVDENQVLAGQYGIRSIPSLLFFKDGQVVEMVVGAQGKDALQEKIVAHKG